MVIFQYKLYIFWIHLWTMLYPKPCYNKPCYKEIVVYMSYLLIRCCFFFNPNVLIFFLFFHEKVCCGYSLEAPQWGASNEYPQRFHGEIIKIFTRYPLLSRPVHLWSCLTVSCMVQGLGGSFWCAIRLETGGRGFNPRQSLQHSFVEIDHEIFFTVILSLPLIQERQLSVSGERMCTILVNRLED